MGRTIFQELVRRARGPLTQERFAVAISASKGSVANWEQGKKRPSPDALKKIADAVPALRAEVERLIASYEWHPERIEKAGGLGVPGDLAVEIRRLAKQKGLDEGTALRQAISVGLRYLSTPSAEAGASTPRERIAELDRVIADLTEATHKVEERHGHPGQSRRRKKTKSGAA